MTFTKKLIASSVAAATLVAGSYAPVASAELSGSVAIASTYLWRGIDLGSGTPAVSGDLSYSAGGFYTGVWTSSGDTGAGSEFDLYAGFGGEAGLFSYDISIWNYLYPNGTETIMVDDEEVEVLSQEDTIADLSEVIVTLGVGPVSFSWYENVANNGGSEEYRYYTLGTGFGAYSVTVGHHDDVDLSMTHLDVSYAYSDNLAFTFSQVVDDDDDAFDDDLKVVVSYSLPL